MKGEGEGSEVACVAIVASGYARVRRENLNESKKRLLKVLRFSFPVPLEKNFELDLWASLLAHCRHRRWGTFREEELLRLSDSSMPMT